MAKTPSVNVIAAKWILHALEDCRGITEVSEHLTDLADSRVSKDKAEKVRDQREKIIKKLVERCQKIVDKFEAPPSGATKKPPPKGGTPKRIDRDEE